MPTVESDPTQPAAVSPPMPSIATPEPSPTWAKRLEALQCERAQLESEKKGALASAVALELIRDDKVSPTTRARSEYITNRLAELDKKERLLQPHVLEEERVKLIAEQLAAFELRKRNQAKAAAVQAHIDDLQRQVIESEKQLHRWKTTEPDGVFGSSQRLTRHRNAHPEIEG
jgi:vacuolar-type H+-ATPase subunit I/STV1